MQIVILTAFVVGGATVLGASIGFLIKNPSPKISELILAFAAGIMLSASVSGLIQPALDAGGSFAVPIAVSGVFLGALALCLTEKALPLIKKLLKINDIQGFNSAFMLVLAIAIHNLPEGIAAGVGFGTDNTAQALSVAIGIALQNIPEGMVIIAPMLTLGVSGRKTLAIALSTALIEIIGTLFGYFAISLSSAILPFILAYAGGTMLYVVIDEMIPNIHSDKSSASGFSLLFGYCLMLVINHLI